MALINAVKDVMHGMDHGDPADSINAEIPSSPLSPLLNKNSARVEDAIQAISGVMNLGERDSDKLGAAREILNLHGVRKDESHRDNRIMIVFEQGAEDKDGIANILNPNRTIEV